MTYPISIMEYLKKLVDMTSGKQREYYQWIIRNGITLKARQVGVYPNFDVKINQCYRNSLMLSLTRDYEYVEGFMMHEDIPICIEHGFNLGKKNRIVDVTADKFKFKPKEYFGIIIPHEYLMKIINRQDTYMTPLQQYYLILMEEVEHEKLMHKS
jgi:hypothetical protein